MTYWPDLAAIEALVAVADHGSIAAAARATGMAQPNVSRSVARLERRLGLPLLQRSTTGATITEPGRQVVEWSRDLLDAARRLGAGAAALAAGPAALTLAASHTVAESLVPGWLTALRALRPGLAVRVEVQNSAAVAAALLDGSCDLGFVEAPQAPRGLHSRVVATDELVLVVPAGHPLSTRAAPLPMAELARWPLVTREPGSGTRIVLENALAAAGVGPVTPVQVGASNATVRVAVLSGAGVAVLSRLAVQAFVDAGTLVEVPLDVPIRRPLRALWAGSARPAGAVADLLRVAATSLR